jgi:hypothetical protein
MPTLLLSPRGTDLHSLRMFNDIPDGCLLDRWGREPSSLSPRVPYLLGSDQGFDELRYCHEVEPYSGVLCDICQDFGGPTTVALAEIFADMQAADNDGPDALSYAQAATSVYAARRRQFLSAMRNHEQSLDNYRRATARGAPQGLPRAQALEAVQRSGQELNDAFRLEVNMALKRAYTRSTLVTPAGKRVPDRVRNSPKITRLELRSLEQAASVSRFARVARWLGPGALAVDIAERIAHVRTVYDAGGDWHREVFVETGGFVTSSAIGGMGTRLTIFLSGGTLLITRSPALAVATAGAGVAATAHATDTADRLGKDAAGQFYDQIAHLLKHGS